MDILSLQFLSALAAIVVIDLVLAGDNAIVIGLAARRLPPELQKKAVLWGAVGAVVVRAVLTLAVVWLLRIPGFLLVGGLALIWIAYQLMEEDGDWKCTGTKKICSLRFMKAQRKWVRP